MNFTTPPPNFHPSAEAAGCYIESNGQLLFLKRAPDRHSPNTWGVPAGKLEPGEDPRNAVVREVFEEAGLFIDTPDLQFLGRLYISNPFPYIFHIFRKPFVIRPTPYLNNENTDSQWLTPAEALSFPLIPGGPEALNYYLQRRNP